MSRQVTYQHFMTDDITVPMSWHPLTTTAWYIDSQTTRGAPLPRLHCEVTEFKPQNFRNELVCRMRPLDASNAVWDASTSLILAARTCGTTCGSTWLSIVATNYRSYLLKAKTLATVIGSCGFSAAAPSFDLPT